MIFSHDKNHISTVSRLILPRQTGRTNTGFQLLSWLKNSVLSAATNTEIPVIVLAAGSRDKNYTYNPIGVSRLLLRSHVGT